MTDDDKLSDLLARAVEPRLVSSAPVDRMISTVARRRRRRAVAGLVVTSVGVAGAVAATALGAGGHSDRALPVAPTGMRFVGIGHAAIALPSTWGDAKGNCGRQGSTVTGPVLVCSAPRNGTSDGHDMLSVQVERGRPSGRKVERTFEIDGVRVERSETTCAAFQVATGRMPSGARTSSPSFLDGSATQITPVCASTVYVPSEDVYFWAFSSTSKGQVNEILSRIRILAGASAVPLPSEGYNQHPHTGGYLKDLRNAGLVPDVHTVTSLSLPPGVVTRVDPQPGTMLPLGSTVSVNVTTHGSGSSSPTALKDPEFQVATNVARLRQRTVKGTFIGATAFASSSSSDLIPNANDPACAAAVRLLVVRLVWQADANFVHGGSPGSPGQDGPRKALLIKVLPGTGRVCESSARYADVGAAPYETLLYGQWPG